MNGRAGRTTAWLEFFRLKKPLVKRDQPHMNHHEITQIVAALWRALPDNQKAWWKRYAIYAVPLNT